MYNRNRFVKILLIAINQKHFIITNQTLYVYLPKVIYVDQL